MATSRLRFTGTLGLAIAFALLGLCPQALAQQVSYALLQPAAVEPLTMVKPSQPLTSPDAPGDHRFWDRENTMLFAATAAFATADFVATRDNLRSGGRELNPMTRMFAGSTPALAMNFAGETAGTIGLSYFFHRMGHHKLERVTSMVSISGSAAAVTFDLRHR